MKWKELVAHDNIKGNKARETIEHKGWKMSTNMAKICS
jgi:hypothetical protein